MTNLNFTAEELEYLWIKVSLVINNRVAAGVKNSKEENDFLGYIFNIKQLVKTVEPRSWSINEVFNEEESIKEPKDMTVLTDPLENMPLRINDPNIVIQTVAVWRLEIAK